jgi:hypothetical protein
MSERLGRNPFDKKRATPATSVMDEVSSSVELEGELIDLPEENSSDFQLNVPNVGAVVSSVLRIVLRKG